MLTIEIFASSLLSSGKYLLGSGIAFIVANTLPEEESLIKMASAITGWVLAIVCIWTLAKAVRFLYQKIEEKDAIITGLHTTAEAKADTQRKEILEELKTLNDTRTRQ